MGVVYKAKDTKLDGRQAGIPSMNRARIFTRVAVILTLLLAVQPSAMGARGGNKPPKGGGGSCISNGVDANDDGFIEGSTGGLFVSVAEIPNPAPSEGGVFGVSVDAPPIDASTILAAVVSKAPGKVDIFSITSDTGSAALLDTVVIPGLGGQANSARAELEDVDGDGVFDVVVVHGGSRQGWIYLGPNYSGGSPIELLPVVSPTTVQDAGDLGAKGSDIVFNELLYLPARGSTVESRGPRGAVFVCDLTANPIPPSVNCNPLATPQDFGVSDYDVFGIGIVLGDVTGDSNPEFLVSANGAGKGKNSGPDRIFVYGSGEDGFDLSVPTHTLTGAAGPLFAFDVTGGVFDEVFAVQFGADPPGKMFADPSFSRDFGDDPEDLVLEQDSNLLHEYGTNSSAGTLADGTPILLVSGPGDPEGCNGGVNNGFAYFYVFDQFPATLSTAQSPTSNGADFGWEVAATGTDLVLVSERAATLGEQAEEDRAGKIHVYQY